MDHYTRFRSVMLALGTPSAELESEWERQGHPEILPDELAAARRLLAKAAGTAPGQTFDATGDADAIALVRFGSPRSVRRATDIRIEQPGKSDDGV